MKPVRNKFKHLAAAACFLLVAASAFSEEEKTAAFPFYKDITLPGSPKDVSVFTIDADIYRATENIPNDIRVFGPDGELCPFIIGQEFRLSQGSVSSGRPARITGFETLPDGSVRIAAEIPSDLGDEQVVGMKIVTKAKDFDKKVKVFGKNGETLIAEGAFLDYSSRVDLRNDFIAFPAPVKESGFVIVMDNYTEIKDSPRFRVVEGDNNILEQEKFRESPKIDGISLQVVKRQMQMDNVWVSSPTEILSREKKGKTTVVKFSNGFAPLRSIAVESSDAFFSRPYRLYGKSGKLVASGTIRKLSTASFHTQDSERIIDLPASSSRSETWTLELDNGENDELKDITLQASGPVYQVRFLSMKPTSPVPGPDGTAVSGYRIFYGGTGHPMPSADFTDVLRGLEEPVRADSTLSEQKANPHYKEKSDIVRDWGVVYKIVMAAAALAVFLVLLFSVKKIDKVGD